MAYSRTMLVLLLALGLSATGHCEEGDPDASALQEMFDLSARRTKVLLDLSYIDKRLATLEKEQLAQFERVAEPTGSLYWESISDDVLSARATADISKDELLLYHAPAIYRVKKSQPKLTTEGECWYFRPNVAIAKGNEFSIVLVHDAPEELKNVADGFMPHTQRARDPKRAYRTKIQTSATR